MAVTHVLDVWKAEMKIRVVTDSMCTGYVTNANPKAVVAEKDDAATRL